ncbi:hypothetical protein BDW75DRAFT_31384 [Aspergillus navahoensis]
MDDPPAPAPRHGPDAPADTKESSSEKLKTASKTDDSNAIDIRTPFFASYIVCSGSTFLAIGQLCILTTVREFSRSAPVTMAGFS